MRSWPRKAAPAASNETRWIIDPLDGTTNFLHGFPAYAVSIGCEVRGRLEVATVYDVLRQELFTATRGVGAQLDSRRIRVSRRRGLEGALLATGFPFRANDDLDTYLEMLRIVMPQVAGVRRAGSAALDLAYVAAGRVDGFWELGLKPWDTAAGVLLVTEAGGHVSKIDGERISVRRRYLRRHAQDPRGAGRSVHATRRRRHGQCRVGAPRHATQPEESRT